MERRRIARAPSVSQAEHGFTLIELMISVAIVGVLSSAAIPAFMRYTEKARNVEAIENMAKIADAVSAFYQAHSQLPVSELDEALGSYTGSDKFGFGWGPSEWYVCNHHGRATQQDIDMYYGNTATWNVLRRVGYSPTAGAMFSYQYWGQSSTNAADGYIWAWRVKNCNLTLGRYIQFRMRLRMVEGSLRREGPRLISD